MKRSKFVGLAVAIAIVGMSALAWSQGWFTEPRAMLFKGRVQFDQPITMKNTTTLEGTTTYTLGATEKMLIDGSTTAQTQTDGALDINASSGTANASGFNVSLTTPTGTASGTDVFGGIISLTQNDADADMFGLKITGEATTNAAAGSYEYLLFLDCAENTAGACPDGLLVTSSGVNAGMTDGIDVSAANITNGINLGPNILLMTAGDMNADSLAVDTTDDMTLKVTSGVAAEDLTIWQSGANDSSLLLVAEGTGTDAIGITAAAGTVDIDGADVTMDASDDITVVAADDLTLNGNSAGSVINLGTNNDGNAINIGTDDTAADTIIIGSAKDSTTVYGLDVVLDSADDTEFNVADDFTVRVESAGGVVSFDGTLGATYNIGTDNSVKDTITIGSALDDVILAGTAGAEAGAGVAAAERCVGAICQTVFTLTNATIAITDPGGAAAYGGLKIYDFPQGRLLALGVVADLTLTEASGTIDAAFDGDISLGTTVAEATATLHNPTTEDDWVPTVATTQAVTSIAVADFQSTVTEQVIHDGHTTAIDLYLNVEVDDADITTGAADSLTANGTITITWINLGDN